jgi:cytochrome c peroxidase
MLTMAGAGTGAKLTDVARTGASWTRRAAGGVVIAAAIAGCAAEQPEEDVGETNEELVSGGAIRGAALFSTATFGGNGRTCLTCHSLTTGTISPAQADLRFRLNPSDPLFRKIDSDDGASNQYTRLRKRATVRVEMNLPPNVHLAGSPDARQVVLNRGVPTVINTPRLDKLLMVDGRETSVETQALNAVRSHFEPGALPTARDLSDIAAFERTLFSSAALRSFANGGAAPALPQGTTALERAGRRFFTADGPSTDPKSNMCGSCHGGPMLDTLVEGIPGPPRFGSVMVSELNAIGNPLHTFVFKNPDGSETTVESPDPGLALVTGNAEDANMFRTPTLWGVKKTAPYFHDNSAASLEQVMDHYQQFFDIVSEFAGIDLRITNDEKKAMVAYMKLL